MTTIFLTLYDPLVLFVVFITAIVLVVLYAPWHDIYQFLALRILMVLVCIVLWVEYRETGTPPLDDEDSPDLFI